MGFFSSSDRRSDKQQSPHLLDLKQDQGGLQKPLLDFPAQQMDPDQRFLRRQERWTLPPSYRSGLAFFAAVLLISVLGLTTLDAHLASQAQRQLLGAQLLDDLRVWSKAPGSHKALAESSDVPSVLERDPLPEWLQSEGDMTVEGFEQWRHALSQGHQHYAEFLALWTTDELPLEERLDQLEAQAQQTLSWWKPGLEQASLMLFPGMSDAEYAESQAHLSSLSQHLQLVQLFSEGTDTVQQLLGLDQPQRIVVLIQGDQERRGTGGTLSAGVEMLVSAGDILRWEPFHVGEYEDALPVSLQPPAVLANRTDRWSLATSNASVDVPRSAEQFHWFWQRQVGSSIDVLAFVSTDALEQLFALHQGDVGELNNNGPYNENFGLLWGRHELADDREALKGLADGAVQGIVDLLKEPQQLLDEWAVLQSLLRQKQLSLYSPHEGLQADFVQAGVSGSLPDLAAGEDVLMVSRLTMAEGLSEADMEDDYTLHTAIDATGAIKHWLRLRRIHTGSVLPEGVEEPERLSNQSLMQVLVPKGSTLLSVDGVDRALIDTQEADNFTLWTFPMQVYYQGQGFIALSYELPWRFDTSVVDNYRLHWLKQPGTPPPRVDTALRLPEGMTVFQELPAKPLELLQQDEVIAVVAGRNPGVDL